MTKNNYYSGIGSRTTPQDILEEFKHIGLQLANSDFILRSGGAKGSDLAFEYGCDHSNFPNNKEVYLPWKGFNESHSNLILETPIPKQVEDICKDIYLRWYFISDAIKRLHARNCYQILGQTLDKPSSFVICWTDRDENDYGGTMFGIKLARKYSIPVYNFYKPMDKIYFYSMMKK